jgi:murein DD-endopeptidase MepM/ murein hydrolase activator NlpD
MPAEEGRRKRDPVRYEILLVPKGEGGKKRSFIASRVRLWVYGFLAIILIVAAVLSLLIYTPIVMYIPIKNPDLERRYGQQILDTQRQLNDLAKDVLVLRDYNQQLRKALGEFGGKDSTKVKSTALNIRESSRFEPAGAGDTANDAGPDEFAGGGGDEGLDLNAGSYDAVVTGQKEFHASFPILPPTDGFITQGFDPQHRHFGIDYAVKRGTPVYAATDGYVVFADWTYDGGNMLILSHGGGYLTVYKHNQLLLKSAQTYVKRGELIAQSGSTGQTSSGPHLHFELWRDGVPQDPQEYLLTVSKNH